MENLLFVLFVLYVLFVLFVLYVLFVGLAAMAFNRLVSIMFPISYNHVFSQTNTKFLIAGLFVAGFCASIPALFPCCHTVWDHTQYLTSYQDPDANGHYGNMDLVLNSLSVAIMIICYAAI